MDKNRPIVAATLGYILGIIWGLYFNKSIVSKFIFIIAILIILRIIVYIYQKHIKKEKTKKFKFFSLNKIFRYIKLILNIDTTILIIIFFIISNLNIQILNNKYENLYSNIEEVNAIAKIVDNGTQKEYSTMYKIRVESINNSSKYKNTNLYLKVNKKLKINLQYGDKIQIQGTYIEPDVARNYKGFDYSKYLRTLKIYGTVKTEKISVIENKNSLHLKSEKDNLLKFISNRLSPSQIKDFLFKTSNDLFCDIKENVEKNLDSENAGLLLGILFGHTEGISDETKEAFKQSNISHILAVSGMHISYIILAVSMLAIKSCGKKLAPKTTIVFIIAYMFITNFTPSVTRAGIMGIVVLLAKITHNKSDIWTSISISLLIILIYNPYLITNAGVLLSYGGTIGIIIFQKSINLAFQKLKEKSKILKYKNNKILEKILDYIQDTLAVSISAQIVIAPIMIQMFNTFGITFFITNLLVSFIIGPIIIIGFLFIISIFLYQYFLETFILDSIFKFIYKIIKFLIEKLLYILIEVAKLGEILPFSSINVKTLPIWIIILYYIVILIVNQRWKVLNKKQLIAFDKRLINWKNLIKHRIRKDKNKIVAVITVLTIVIGALKIIPNDLHIYFVDVGQGDCTLIVTPSGKNILIDGGGSENYDVGKNTLLPYLLDRGITKLDYVMISHFDSDHVKSVLTILEEIKVEKVIICKQYESSENYTELLKIIQKRNIFVKQVQKGERINIEKDISIDILFPISAELISENSINNNSIVAKFNYKNFSMLFTGDIEEIAEEKLVELYGKTDVLKSTILKVAHHGSKTSTTQKFLELVSPQIALIGVGSNNLYGHPNANVISRLEDLNAKIYRTDKMGEVTIRVSKNGKNWIDKMLN